MCTFVTAMRQPTHNAEQEARREAIQQLLDSGCCFVIYRRPKKQEVEVVIQTEGDAEIVQDDDKILNGFVFAPFHSTKHRPTLLIKPDKCACGWQDIILSTKKLPARKVYLNQLDHHRAEYEDINRSRFYKERYYDVISQIQQEKLEKVVLTYCQQEYGRHHLIGKEADMFLQALAAYPTAFVYLIYTPQGGRWMGCTPELLLERKDNHWHTMALAGTSTQEDGEWDTKNVHEQDVVTRYLVDTLHEIGAEEKHDYSNTLQIGELRHIHTSFNFCFAEPKNTIEVARTLHPTPAVCGFPKQKAYQYIRYCEKGCRNYFSGYLGPIIGNEEAHLYVNLRCAQITKDCTYYHAGGGITALSLLWEEQQEINRKMQILKSLV